MLSALQQLQRLIDKFDLKEETQDELLDDEEVKANEQMSNRKESRESKPGSDKLKIVSAFMRNIKKSIIIYGHQTLMVIVKKMNT